MTTLRRRLAMAMRGARRAQLVSHDYQLADLLNLHRGELRVVSWSTVRRAMRGERVRPATTQHLDEVLGRLFAANPAWDDESVDQVAPVVSKRQQDARLRTVAPDYSGVWLLLHPVTIRSDLSQVRPPDDKFRSAILIYGDGTRRGQSYTIFGNSKTFHGDVTLSGNRLYYEGREITQAVEKSYIISREPHGRTAKRTHEGIMLGVGISDFDEGIVYAVRVLFIRMSDQPFDDARIAEERLAVDEPFRKMWCHSFTESELVLTDGLDDTELARARRAQLAALGEFRKRTDTPISPRTHGIRLFLG
jgi:hypothetical protein